MKSPHHFCFFLAAAPSLVYANHSDDAAKTSEFPPTEQQHEQTSLVSSSAVQLEQAVADGHLIQALEWGQKQEKSKTLSAHETQILAKTARQVGQLSLAENHYRQLSKHPKKEIAQDGLLGLMLVSIDARNSAAALKHAQNYQKHFGEDDAWQSANRYYEQMFGQSFQDALTPKNTQQQILQAHKLAAQNNRFPTQRHLQHTQSQYFDHQDQNWLALAEQQEVAASTQLSSSDNAQLLQVAQQQALVIGSQAPAQSALQQAALQTVLDASLRLGDAPPALKAYETWFDTESQVDPRLQAAYAKNLLDDHQHHKALKEFEALPKEALDDDVYDRQIAALADAGLMTYAQEKLQTWPTHPTINDYTHNYRLPHPYHAEKPFWHIRLLDWNGQHKKANDLIEQYLQEAPANTNALKLKGDLRRWQGFGDDALKAYDDAAYFLHPDEQLSLEANRATVYLDLDHPQAAKEAINQLPDYVPSKQDLLQRLNLQNAAYWQSQLTFSDTTSPANMENEWRMQSKIASNRHENGLRFYAEHDVQTSPQELTQLRAQRAGVGLEWNRHPTQWNISMGSGTELNHKPYIHLGMNHRFNQYIKAGMEIQKNSDAIPLKALQQDVYANALMGHVNLHLHADVDAGLGVAVNDYDDGNLRREAYAFVSSTLWQRDRWSFKNYSRIDWQQNREVSQAHYYNPHKAWSYGTELGLQYRYPFDHQITMTHTVSGGMGRYHQQNQQAETTWLTRYEQEWNIQDRYSIGFQVGRKRAIYDGLPEYSNFIGLNTQMRF